jgi:hypothetical protein
MNRYSTFLPVDSGSIVANNTTLGRIVPMSRELIRKIMLLVSLISLLCFSCNETEESMPVSMKELKPADIVFSIKNRTYNFLTSKFHDIEKSIGDVTLSEIVGGNEKGPIIRKCTKGVIVEYYQSDGILRKISISDSDVKVLKGIAIGDSKDKVKSLLKDGINSENGGVYTFVMMDQENNRGVGYEIMFDANRVVKEIYISIVAFAP